MCGHMFWSSMSCNFVSDRIANSPCVTMLMKEVLGDNVEMMILSDRIAYAPRVLASSSFR